MFIVRATDSSIPSLSDTETFTISVFAGFAFTTASLEDAIINRTYSKNIRTNVGTIVNMAPQGQDPLTSCSVPPGNLPPGMMLALGPAMMNMPPTPDEPTLCVLSGTPTMTGSFPFTITATDSANNMRSTTYTLVVRSEFMVGAITSPSDAVEGRMYTNSVAIPSDLQNNPVASEVASMEPGNGPVTGCIALDGATALTNFNGTPTANTLRGLTVTCDMFGSGATSARVNFSGTVTAGTAETRTLTVRLFDSVISEGGMSGGATVVNIPGNAMNPLITSAFMLTFRDEFMVTEPSVVDAVNGRPYTKHINTDLLAAAGPSDVGQTTELGNGPAAVCTATINGNALPFGGFSIATETNGCRLMAGSVTLAAGSYTLAITVTDTDIPGNAGVAVAGNPIMRSYTLNVRAESTFATTTVVDGITLRNYTKTLTTDKNNPNPTGAGNVTMCALSGTPPPSLTVAVAANNLDCVLTAAPLSDAPGTYNFTVTATDADITQLNSSSGMNDVVVAGGNFNRMFTITVRGEFSVTEPFLVDAINGRPYTKHVNASLVTAAAGSDVGQATELGNGPSAACSATIDTVPSTGAQMLPFGGFSIATETNGCRLMAANVTLAAGPYALAVSVTDNTITQLEPRTVTNPVVVPTNTIMRTYTLNVRAGSTFLTTTVVDGIQGRNYSKTLTTDKNNPSATGAGNITMCALSGTPPASVSVAVAANNLDCVLTATPLSDAPGNYNFTVTATEADITQLNSSTGMNDIVVAGGTFNQMFTITVRGEFSVTEPFVVDAINGRPYTKHINTDLVATDPGTDVGQAGELGNGAPAACSATIGGNALPFGGFMIAPETNGCRLSTAAAVSLAPGSYALVVSVTDNPITQLNPRTGMNPTVVTAQPIMQMYTLTVRPDSTFVTTTVVDGITQRSYTKTLVTDKNNPNPTGAGNITMCALSGTPPPSLSVAVAANNVDCMLTAGSLSDPPGNYNFTVMATDSDITQLNSSTGTTDIVVAGGTFSRMYRLVVRDEFTFLTSSLVNGVEGRDYTKVVETNLSNNATDVGQTAEFGNGPIQTNTCALDGTSDPLPTALSVSNQATNLHCQISGTITAGQGGMTFGTTSGIILAVTDTPILQLNPRTGMNETVVPANTILSVVTPFQLYVRFPLAFELTSSNCVGGGTCPVAVKGRSYNVTNGVVRQIDGNTVVTGGDVVDFSVSAPFTLSGGTWVGDAGTACEGITIDRSSGFLNGGPTGLVAGICSFTVTLNDSGIDQASVNFGVLKVVPVTPPGQAVQAFSIEVQPEMTIVNALPFLPGGLKGSFYTVSLAVTGGLSTTTGPVNLPAIVEWSILNGPFFSGGVGVPGTPCEGLGIIDLDGTPANQGATISGPPVTPGDCGPFTIQVTDNGNEPGTANFVPNGIITQMFTIVINDTIGFVTNVGGGYTRVIRTDTDSVQPAPNLIPSPAGATPRGIAVHPSDPLFAYVANESSLDIGIFCTRVELPFCPVAFAPPAVGPTTINMVVGSVLGNVADVAVVSTNPALTGAAALGVIADPTFIPCGGGAIYSFNADRTSAAFNMTTGNGTCLLGARSVSMRPQGDFVFTVNGTDLVFVNGLPSFGGPTVPIPFAGVTLNDIAVSPDGRFAYATDTTNGQVFVISADPTVGFFYVAATPAAGSAGGLLASAVPMFIAFAPDGRFAYVTDSANNVVAAVDPTTLGGGSVLVTNNNITLAGGTDPRGIALTDDSQKAFVANFGNDSVTSINTDATPPIGPGFQTALTNFNGAGNFFLPFGVDLMRDPHLHILNPLPVGITGGAYDATIVAAGGTRPYTFSSTALPANLMLDPATGRITGTPAMAGTTIVTFTVMDSSMPTQTSSRDVTITIVDPTNVLPTTPITDAVSGRTYMNQFPGGMGFLFINAGGNATSLNTGDPDCSGLSLSTSGLVSGTASRGGDGVCVFNAAVLMGSTVVDSKMLTLNVRNEFTVNEPFLVPAVAGRAYSKHIDTSLVMSPGPNDNGQVAEFGNGPAVTCTVTIDGNALPFGGFTIATETNGCLLSTPVNVTLMPGMHSVVVSVTDNPIGTIVPQNTVTSISYTLNVRAEFSITEPNVVDGIAGRAYSKAINTNLATNGSGAAAMCSATIDGNPSTNFGFTTTPSGTACVLAATALGNTLPAGDHTLVVMITDAPIMQDGVMVVAPATAMQMYTFTIRNDFSVTEPNVVDGVSGRAFSKFVGTNLLSAAGPSDVNQTAEIGNGPAAACTATINGNALPFGGFTIAPETNGCRLMAGTVSLTPGDYTLVVMVTDNDILQNAAVVVAGATKSATYTFTIRAEFTISEPNVVDGIAGRAYSKHINTDLLAVAGADDLNETTEIGNGPPSSCTATIAGNPLPAGFSIATETNGCLFTATSGATTTLGAGTYMLAVMVTDNDITQGVPVVVAKNPISRTYTFTIRSDFTITEPNLVDGITGRAYSKHINTDLNTTAGANDVNQTAEKGNGPAAACAATIDTVPPSGAQMLPFGGLDIVTETNGCRLSTAATLSLAAGSYTIDVMVSDNDIMQNAATVVTAATKSQMFSFTVRSDFMVTNTPSVSNGIAGRSYTATFTVMTNLRDVSGADPGDVGSTMENGNSPITTCGVSGLTGSGLSVTAVTVNGTTGNSCQITISGSSAVQGSYMLTATATDTDILQNASTVVGAATKSSGTFTLTINADNLAFSLATNPGGGTFDDTMSMGNAPDAVFGRQYGGTGRRDLRFTATGGNAPYSWNITTNTLSPALTCTQSGANNEFFTCNTSDAAVTTTAGMSGSIAVSLMDSGSGGVGVGTRTSDDQGHASHMINVKASQAITTAAGNLTNGLVNFVYPGFTLTNNSGGAGNLNWYVSTTLPGAGACSGGDAPTGAPPTNITIGMASGMLMGTPTAASTADSDFTFQACLADSGNDTTPAGATGSKVSFTINVFNTFAYAAAPGTDTVEVINTQSPGTDATRITRTGGAGDIPISTGAGSDPDRVAVTPNGHHALVTLKGANAVGVINTITNALVDQDGATGGVQNFGLSGCTNPTGIAVNRSGTRAYVACNGNNVVAVVNVNSTTGILTANTTIASVTGAPEGVAAHPSADFIYVTRTTGNSLAIIADQATPSGFTSFALEATDTSTPMGIAIATTADGTRAYIAKKDVTNDRGAAEILDLATPGSPAPLANSPILSLGSPPDTNGANQGAARGDSVAFLQDGSRVFLTMPITDNTTGTPDNNSFAVINNTTVPAVSNDEVTTANGVNNPIGITVPPVTGAVTGARIFIAQRVSNNVRYHDNAATTYGENTGSPLSLAASSGPRGIAHIPIPK
jgi:6-phosphogluconolactonase (cycloisomerase 2 family)